MRRPLALALTIIMSGTALAACSSSSSTGSTTTTTAVKIPTTLAGTMDCTKFQSYATEVQTLVNSKTSASASTPAAELAVIRQLDSISGQAIDLLKPIAPDLVTGWHKQTQASLATLQAAVAKGATAANFSSVIQKSNTPAYQKISKQIGLIVHDKCPGLSSSTTTTTTPAG